MCWYCHHGWPKEISDVYLKAASKIGEYPLEASFSHIVWSDCNFGDDSIRWCLKESFHDKYKDEFSSEEIEIARKSLIELKEIDKKYRDNDWMETGESYEKCPPPSDWIMVSDKERYNLLHALR